MKISEIKNKMLAWQDFYGGDIPNSDDIRKAKTKYELAEILNQHKRLMENTLYDALGHLETFKGELGL